MRISSNVIYDSNVTAMGQLQARMLQTQQQITSGRRILTAADDPVAAARALDISQSDGMNNQYAANRQAAKHTLSVVEANLQSVTTLLQDVKTAAVTAGNGSFTDSDRISIANELQGRLEELTGYANSTDGIGNYLFAGYQTRTQPFVDTPAGMGYFGDDGQRLAQVSASRQISTSNSGADVFMRIKSGNGTFLTQAAAANTGTGVTSAGSVTDSTLLKAGHTYNLTFSVGPDFPGGPDLTKYIVRDTTPPAVPPGTQVLPDPLLPPPVAPAVLGVPYVSGQAISFDGLQFDIQGVPTNGDTFTVVPSANESMFTTISDLIDVLKATPVGASLTNGLNRSLNHLDNALNNVLTVRSSLGVRLNEVEALDVEGENLGLQFRQSLSLLQDVDYNKAISDLTMQQTALQAAQQTFAKVAGLSLFNYI
ncbi:MAG: flagellar hook-associated protein 3 [Gallionellales bacterium GWA2_60_18]|nr:MAG: flagellar hook-associated protein 3 [Gallionellales bacterium GWA2_60_18]